MVSIPQNQKQPCDIFKNAKRGLKIRTSVNCSPLGKEFAAILFGDIEARFGYFRSEDSRITDWLLALIEMPFESWPKETSFTIILKKSVRKEDMLDDLCAMFQSGHGKIEII